ncbi:MAG: hypothetical protein JO257_06145 [Deltaproteobacteria bacterium]|nr:hypothetical protein [Deltaproteobacteria bacterium]
MVSACVLCWIAWWSCVLEGTGRLPRSASLLALSVASAVLYRMLRAVFPSQVPGARVVTASAAR